jgi:hypothetical protein
MADSGMCRTWSVKQILTSRLLAKDGQDHI